MVFSLVDCLKGLMGVDEEEDNSVYMLCHSSCLCTGGNEDPVCTDYHIMDKFCPKEIFGGVTTTVTSSSPATTTIEVGCNQYRFKKYRNKFI
jgi:hypothetical protein